MRRRTSLLAMHKKILKAASACSLVCTYPGPCQHGYQTPEHCASDVGAQLMSEAGIQIIIARFVRLCPQSSISASLYLCQLA